MRILVLGGTGAMGVHLVKALSNRGDDVYVTSRKKLQSDCDKIHYIQGNAHSLPFVIGLLSERYDVIVDFMVYHINEFRERIEMFLNKSGQYIYFSSSRVYAESDKPIDETSPRLYDVCTDKNYMATDEYALSKAKQENLLFNNPKNNWTIIRPYITYSNERLQLGIYEKEEWLFRALNGKPIVFSEDISEKYTTLTSGKDVSDAVVMLIGNEKAYGEIYNITGNQSMTWGEVLEIYRMAIHTVTGKSPDIYYVTDASYTNCVGNPYQLNYDRLYNRKFDNSKIVEITSGNVEFQSMKDGLKVAIDEFIIEHHRFKTVSWKWEGRKDRICKFRTPLHEIPNKKAKLTYIIFRYFPGLGNCLERIASLMSRPTKKEN